MSNKNTAIGQRIKEIRVSRKETLEEFANAIQNNADKTIKTTKSNVSKWEKGLNIPNDIALFSIASIGGVSVNYLLTGQSESKVILKNTIDSLEKDIDNHNTEITGIKKRIDNINTQLNDSSNNNESKKILEIDLENLQKEKLRILNLRDFDINELKKQKKIFSDLNDGLIFNVNDKINPDFQKNGTSQKQISDTLKTIPYLLDFENTMKVYEYAQMLLDRKNQM